MSKAHRKSVEKQRQPFRQPNMHITSVSIRDNGREIVGTCTCGWEGRNRTSVQAAIEDTRSHTYGQAQTQNAKEEQANRRDVAAKGGYNEGGGYSGGDK